MARLKLRSAVLCEEVRREATGSAILIGASIKGPDVKNGEETTIDRLAFYLEASLKDTDVVGIRLWSDEYETSIFETKFDFSDDERPPLPPDTDHDTVEMLAVMVVNKSSVKIPGPGAYDLQIRLNNTADWTSHRTYVFPSPDWRMDLESPEQ